LFPGQVVLPSDIRNKLTDGNILAILFLLRFILLVRK